MLSSNWAAALEPNILEWIHEGFNTHPDTTTDIFKIKDESAGVIRFQDSWGPRIIPSSTEDGATSLLEKQKGYQTLLAPTIYKGKMKVSRETKRWNYYPQIEDDAKDLGSAAKETLNLIANGVFIVGFNTSYTGYGDGLPIFSTAHTRPDGGSNQSNASSTGITLTEVNLETGVTALRQQKTGTGKKLMVGPGNLVLMVPEALEKEAVIITGSQKRSNTTDNDLNIRSLIVFIKMLLTQSSLIRRNSQCLCW